MDGLRVYVYALVRYIIACRESGFGHRFLSSDVHSGSILTVPQCYFEFPGTFVFDTLYFKLRGPQRKDSYYPRTMLFIIFPLFNYRRGVLQFESSKPDPVHESPPNAVLSLSLSNLLLQLHLSHEFSRGRPISRLDPAFLSISKDPLSLYFHSILAPIFSNSRRPSKSYHSHVNRV